MNNGDKVVDTGIVMLMIYGGIALLFITFIL